MMRSKNNSLAAAAAAKEKVVNNTQNILSPLVDDVRDDIETAVANNNTIHSLQREYTTVKKGDLLYGLLRKCNFWMFLAIASVGMHIYRNLQSVHDIPIATNSQRDDGIMRVAETSADNSILKSVEDSNLDVCARARTINTSASFYSWKGLCNSPDWSVSQTMKGEDGRPTLATLIPALKRDGYEIILKLMESIEMETVPPNEVVIAMSDVGRDETNTFCNGFLKNLTDVFSKSPIKLICIGERMTAGRARNVAAKSSTSELLSMMDSDDTESPIRNEVSKNIFECRGGKLKIFLHSFFQSYKQKDTPSAIPDGYECAEHENGTERLLGEQLYDLLEVSHNRLWIHAPIHHGWPVVHRSVFTEAAYSSLPQGEDSLFVRDVMYSFGRHNNTALFLNRKLGFYVQSSQMNKDLQKTQSLSKTIPKNSNEGIVSCGNHEASSCAECPQGGAVWCNGECEWSEDENGGVCQLKSLKDDGIVAATEEDVPTALNLPQSALIAPPQFVEVCENSGCCAQNSFSFARPSDQLNLEKYDYDYFWEAPFGNGLVHYFNQRAIAFLQNQVFQSRPFHINEDGTNSTLSGMISCFPTTVHPEHFIEDQSHLLGALEGSSISLRDILQKHAYPHAVSTSAYRLIPHTITSETQAIARAWASLPKYTNDAPEPRTAVVHLRCNDYILNLHSDYGILPHRFVMDRLSSEDTDHVTIVRIEEEKDNACQWSMIDLVDRLEEKGTKVTIRSSPDPTRDWLFMARASILFCAPSTFCLTAAWANPNTVFFASNEQAAVVPTDSTLQGIIDETTNDDIQSDGAITMVSIDYLPGQIAKGMSKEAVLNYVQSTHCVSSLYGCIPNFSKIEAVSSSEGEAPIILDIPRTTKEIVINVGSSIDPILPAPEMGPCAKCIAVEPIVGHNIPQHPQVSVVKAAVSERSGVMSMNVYNDGAESSSLAKPSSSQYWNVNAGRGDGLTIIVPVITLSSLISAVPNTTQISLLKTDMQGFDFVAIKEAGSILKERVRHIMTEVWMNDHYTYHAKNDFCRDFLPFMTELGYEIANVNFGPTSITHSQTPDQIRAQCEKQLRDTPIRPDVKEGAGLDERDAFWVRKDSIDIPFPDCPNIKMPRKPFTVEEYAQC